MRMRKGCSEPTVGSGESNFAANASGRANVRKHRAESELREQ